MKFILTLVIAMTVALATQSWAATPAVAAHFAAKSDVINVTATQAVHNDGMATTAWINYGSHCATCVQRATGIPTAAGDIRKLDAVIDANRAVPTTGGIAVMAPPIVRVAAAVMNQATLTGVT